MTILYNLYEALACVFYFALSIITLELVFPHNKRYRLAYVILAGITYFPLTYSPISPIPNLWGSFLSVCIVLFLAFTVYSGKPGHKLLVTAAYNLMDMGLSFFFFHIASKNSGLHYTELTLPGTITRLYTILMIYLTELIVLLLIRRILPQIAPASDNDSPIILLFILCSFFIVLVNFCIQFYFSNGDAALEILGFLSTCFMLIIDFATIFLYSKLQSHNRLLQEAQLAGITMEQQEKQLRVIQENEKKIREIRHDMKAYIGAYQTLLKEGKTEEVINDMQLMMEDRLSNNEEQFCKNLLVDSMLTEKKEQCLKRNISLFTRISIPAGYDDVEMLVVLSNLIDNAIEAQSSVPMDKKAVFIEIIPRPNAISILIKNPVSQSILEQNPALSTTKSDTLNHGLGIGSVKRIVSKRNGILEIGENNGMFYVHIYFPLL